MCAPLHPLQASIIQIVLIMILVAFLLSYVVIDSIPKLKLSYRLARQRRNIKRLEK